MNKSNFNILHILWGIGPSSFGLGNVSLNLAREQNILGYDSKVWCLDSIDDCRWASNSSGLPLSKISNFKKSFPKRLLFSLEMEHAAIMAAKSISVVHQHSLWNGLSRVSIRLRECVGIPVVIAPHGALKNWALRRSLFKKKLALWSYEYKNLHNASCLHAVGENEISDFRDFGLRNPVAVIPNCISLDWLNSDGSAERFREYFRISSDKRVILFLSRISPIKGLPMLFEALNNLRNYISEWLIVIAGYDEFNHSAEIKRIVSQKSMENFIKFVGPLHGQLKKDAFAAAELFVLPSYREASPIVILEALGAGVPVLSTKGSPWEELLKYNCGWWTDISAKAVTEALEHALKCTSEQLHGMGLNGKALVGTKYTWTKSAQMTLELYEWLRGKSEKPDFVVSD